MGHATQYRDRLKFAIKRELRISDDLSNLEIPRKLF
jgi:hypothetical protein